MLKKKIITGFMILGISGIVFADSVPLPISNDDFKIQANVIKVCNIVTGAHDVTLNYDPFETGYVDGITKAKTEIEFNCSKGTEYTWTVSFDGKLEKVGDPTEYLNAQVIPQISNGTDVDGSDFVEILTLTVRIGTGQNVSVGTYEDTVNLTLTW